MGILFAFLSALSFAVSNIMVKKGIEKSSGESNGYFVVILINVFLLGLVFLVPLTLGMYEFVFTWDGFLLFVLAGLFTSGLGRFALFKSINHIGPSRASAIKNAAPIFTIIYALLLLGETLNFLSILGILLLIGAIMLQGLIIFFQSKQNSQTQDVHYDNMRGQWLGYLIGISAAICFGIGLAIRGQGLIYLNNAYFGAWVGAITAFVFIFLYEAVRGNIGHVLYTHFKSFNAYFLGAGILTSLGPLFFFIAASHTQVSYVSVIAGTEPVLTILVSLIILRNQEMLTKFTIIVVLLVLSGTAMIVLAT
ncbi:DMT family transporter [Salicibibacter cibarius]|uniref:DMT family transporter n=1 Tax=Salicibibacter cibarius TaxID=2743000 RepID=A0A7T6Z0H5_9BACI|nr:DMT family transporter [Salicibibacter cibarius]QQK74730.1 DMT family transporter [Salicibibacter cibarius]